MGNAAYEQLQLDVYGEILNAFNTADGDGITIDEDSWRMQCEFLRFLEDAWEKPDDGFWEMRNGALSISPSLRWRRGLHSIGRSS